MSPRSHLLALCFIVWAFCAGCAKRDLRGWRTDSDDQKTYFVLEDRDGTNCPPLFIDQKEWQVEIGERAEIAPGMHKITCGKDAVLSQGVGFEVLTGTTYHFNYWGP